MNYHSSSQYLETVGIISQLFSRFIKQGSNQCMDIFLKYNIQPILHYIRNNLYNDIRVEDLAELACISKDHFSRVFKSITGFAPCEYIIQKRVERAQYLLLTTDLPPKKIIEQTGFRSASYFSRVFKKQTGYSPIGYRKQRNHVE